MNVSRTLIQVYALVGLICAFAAWVMIGRFGFVSPSATTGVIGNIQSITDNMFMGREVRKPGLLAKGVPQVGPSSDGEVRARKAK